jgi:PPP family 3-phenylpropionic acid transporter
VLRLFYACYYAGMGVSVAFFSRYLHSLGLGGRQISFMLAAAPLLNLCGVPLIWGSMADRTRRPDLVLRLVSLFASLLMVPLVFVRTLPGMFFLYAGYQAFAVAIMGLIDSITLERVRQGADYGRIRLWGSFAFAFATPLVGQVLDWRDRSGGDPLVPGLIAAAIGAAFLTSLTVRGRATRERPHASELRTLLRDRRFLFLLVVAPLHWLCAAPYHGYLGVLFGDRHLSQRLLGMAFFVSVGTEMVTLYFFSRLRARFELAPILAVTFAVSSVRWALMAVVQAPWALVALQATHALTFGAFWGSALAWVGECVPPRLRATGQTLFTGVLYGVGNGLGMLGSGALYDAFHRADEAFLVAAGVELIPLALVLSLGRRLDPLRPAPVSAPGS